VNINQLFEILAERSTELTLNSSLEAVILFDITGNEPVKWNGLIKNGAAALALGEPLDEPDITVRAASETAIGVYEKTINPMMAFMTGKIKVSGDISKVSLIKSLLTPKK